MKRSGGKAGRPFGEWNIGRLEKHVNASMARVDDLSAIRAELGYRSTERSLELKNLVDRLIRQHTGSYDPNAYNAEQPKGPEEWVIE